MSDEGKRIGVVGYYCEPWHREGRKLLAPDASLIALFEGAEDAGRARECVNAMNGIPDPTALVEAARRVDMCYRDRPMHDEHSEVMIRVSDLRALRTALNPEESGK